MERQSKRVAVIGAGPSGLAAARYLKAHGFDPVIFEQSERVGGQWNAGAAHSGVWPAMHANGCRAMMRFGDLDYPEETELFPKNEDVLAYLERYVERFHLTGKLRLRTRVDMIARHPAGGWVVHSVTAGAIPRTELFGRVVVASGRYNKPSQPEIFGLASFTGSGGVAHSFDYDGPEQFHGKTVLVAGGSISALEIASELAMSGVKVITAVRRQRYIVKKVIDGVPSESLVLTRCGALMGEALPMEHLAAGLKDFVVTTSGDPGAMGTPKPAENVFAAGITMNQDYLDLIAAGRISAKPWIDTVRGRMVSFDDGTAAEVDAIVLGTGFDLDVPFLDRKTREVLGADRAHFDLHDFTFHPDLPGLAFVGLFPLVGSYFPVAELQARWVAYAWAGRVPMPSRAAMHAGIAAYRARRGLEQEQWGHALALRFARNAGVEPDPTRWPELARALLFGPLTAVSFRLTGPDALLYAAEETATEAARIGAITDSAFTEAEREKLQALASAGRTELAALLTGRGEVLEPTRKAA